MHALRAGKLTGDARGQHKTATGTRPAAAEEREAVSALKRARVPHCGAPPMAGGRRVTKPGRAGLQSGGPRSKAAAVGGRERTSPVGAEQSTEQREATGRDDGRPRDVLCGIHLVSHFVVVRPIEDRPAAGRVETHDTMTGVQVHVHPLTLIPCSPNHPGPPTLSANPLGLRLDWRRRPQSNLWGWRGSCHHAVRM
jgi:hypothetical protein